VSASAAVAAAKARTRTDMKGSSASNASTQKRRPSTTLGTALSDVEGSQ